MTTTLTFGASATENGVLALGIGFILLAIVIGVAPISWAIDYYRSAEHGGADETYAAELHAAADQEPDPVGWSVTERGFDYRLVFERIADGYGAAVSPPAVLFDELAAQLAEPDPSWLTFDTSAWRTVHAASDELGREYATA